MLVFLTNKGEMTAANSAGAHLWQEFVPVGSDAVGWVQGSAG